MNPSGLGPTPGTGHYPAATPPAAARSRTSGSDLGASPRGLPKPGDVFNGYEIVELIGQGNMGRIYRARDQLGRDLALKVILTRVASAEGVARFEREGQAMAAIPRHKHVIGVHSAGTWGSIPYLVLDYVEGENLDEVLRRGPLPAAQAALVAEKLGRALDHVHQSGVLHRDLKPANVLIRAVDGEPLLTDFGLAGLQGADTLTRTGDVIGTPLYMAPEQLLGLHREVDGRADVWSLGVMLYEMATSTLPFPGSTMLEVTDAVLGAEIPSLIERCPDADAGLARIIKMALAKDKAERIPSPGAFAAALRSWRKQRQGLDVELDLPPPTRGELSRVRLLLIAAAVLLVALVSGVSIYLGFFRAAPAEPEAEPATSSPATATLSVAAAAAIEVMEGEIRAGDLARIQTELQKPDLRGLPQAGRLRIHALGISALSRLDAEFQDTSPNPARVEALLRIAGQAQSLGGKELRGETRVDQLLRLIRQRRQEAAKVGGPQLEVRWLEVLEALPEFGFRPTQRGGARFLDDLSLSLEPGESVLSEPQYPRLLRALVRLGVPAYYTPFDLHKAPPPANLNDPIGRYIELRVRLTRERKDPTARRTREVELAQLLRSNPQAFDPRTLAHGLSMTLGTVPRAEELELLGQALDAAPDAFFGWSAHILLWLQEADARAQAGDPAGVKECLAAASESVRRGRAALRADDVKTERTPTETQALGDLLLAQLEAEWSGEVRSPEANFAPLPPEKRSEAAARGRQRAERLR